MSAWRSLGSSCWLASVVYESVYTHVYFIFNCLDNLNEWGVWERGRCYSYEEFRCRLLEDRYEYKIILARDPLPMFFTRICILVLCCCATNE